MLGVFCPSSRNSQRFLLLELMQTTWAINAVDGQSNGKDSVAMTSQLVHIYYQCYTIFFPNGLLSYYIYSFQLGLCANYKSYELFSPKKKKKKGLYEIYPLACGLRCVLGDDFVFVAKFIWRNIKKGSKFYISP